MANIRVFRENVGAASGSLTAIQPLVLGSNEAALAAAARLDEAGFLVPAIRYPTVPRGTARLRVSLSAAHDREDVARLARTLARLHTPT
jgi:8-amino-7-oxononanoate synthase